MSVLSQFFGSSRGIPCELLVVGAGGDGSIPGGSSTQGAGGGAGELIYVVSFFTVGRSYSVVVGSGNCSFGDITALRGSNAGSAFIRSSGGGTINPAIAPAVSGNNTFSISGIDNTYFSYGNSGGSGNSAGVGGGGGGAGGSNSNTSGGAGRSFSITGSPVTYAVGGNGKFSGGGVPAAPPSNRGYGGGSENFGGTGVVIIAYPDTFPAATTTGTVVTPSRSGYRVYQFNADGSFIVN